MPQHPATPRHRVASRHRAPHRRQHPADRRPHPPARPRPGRRRLLAAVLSAATTGLVLLAGSGPAAAATTPDYVALGDSYSSGVGTRSYIDDGTDCQRSRYAYPELAAQRLDATLHFDACSGATTGDVLSHQLGHLSAATSMVTISVGGNDAGFSSVLTSCALPWPVDCTGDIDDAVAFMHDTLPGLLDDVYSAIRTHAPQAHVVVVGYPRLFNGETCNLLARISTSEEAELNHAADVLAGVIAGRAGAHGFDFVDPRSAFADHEVCSDREWINGLSNPIGESYHPNRAGQAGYTDLVAPALGAATGDRSRLT